MRPPSSDTDQAKLAATARLIWVMVLMMILAICGAYAAVGLRLDLWSGRYVIPVVPACALIAWFYRVRRPDLWIAQGAESTAQVLAILVAATLLIYAVAATGFPYRDRELESIDVALGLDWRAYLDFVNAHPWIGVLFNGAYLSLKPQTALVIGALVVTGRFHRLQQFTLALAVTLVLTIAIFMFVPAVGTFAHLGLTAADTPHFSPSMTYQQMTQLEGVRNGTLSVVRFDELEGLIAFPSFHTAAAIIATWGLWPCRGLRWWVAVLNAAMIAATPVDGAHYFVDLPAGAAVAAAGIAIGVRLPALIRHRALPLPAGRPQIPAL